MTAIVWFRQDLRLADNPALHAAVDQHDDIILLYVLDEVNLRPLGGASRWWLHHSLCALQKSLTLKQAELCLKQGDPKLIFQSLCQSTRIDAVYWNRCYEPAAIKRDSDLKTWLTEQAIHVESFNASLLIEPWQIKTQQEKIYQVFTPYYRSVNAKMTELTAIIPPPAQIPQTTKLAGEELDSWQLLPTKPNWASDFCDWQPGEDGAHHTLDAFIDHGLIDYKPHRDLPAKTGTSKLSPHLHFGEISPKQVWHQIKPLSIQITHLADSGELLLRQLVWREFSTYLLFHFPTITQQNFKPQFDAFPWQENPSYLKAWQRGETGFPIVDAGMRQLWQTGYMHNRVRMIVASFLTKDLLIDWRIGEAWFWDTLVDADLGNNIASWQWVAGSGADAAPYFRIFNPSLQSQKFDKNGDYIRQFLPELASLPNRYIHQPEEAPTSALASANIKLGHDYPLPIVNHRQAREKALTLYQTIKS